MLLNPRLKFLLSVLIILGFIVFAFWLSLTVAANKDIQNIIYSYGYAGLFIAAVISGFNLVFPIPAVSFLPALISSGLDYGLSVLILTLGMTVADLAAYVLGRAGRGVFSEIGDSKIIKRLERLEAKHTWLPLIAVFFFAALVPVPNEILVIPLGFLRYKMWSIAMAVFAGSFVFNLLYSMGFIQLFKFF